VGEVETPYLWDRQSGLPLLVDDGTDAYLHADGALAELDGSGQPTYLLDDALGSVRGLTDLGGSLIGTADYDIFGQVRASSGASSVFGFTGEQFDAETGFTFLRARYLDPRLGRFLSADSIQPNAPGTQGYNLYTYVANNPTTWVDPSGHFAQAAAHLTAQVMAHPAIMLVLVRACTQTLVGMGVCIIAIAAPILICALDPGCREWAMERADTISRYGSDAAASATDWVIGQLLKAEWFHPDTPSASKPDTGGQTSSPDPRNWLGLENCKVSFDDEHVFRPEHHLDKIAPTRSLQKELIRDAVVQGRGFVTKVRALKGTRPGFSYVMKSIINGQAVEIRFTFFTDTNAIEIISAFVP
jgi:RHS repeat-associated protein